MRTDTEHPTSDPADDTAGQPLLRIPDFGDRPPPHHPQGREHRLVSPTLCACGATVEGDFCPIGQVEVH